MHCVQCQLLYELNSVNFIICIVFFYHIQCILIYALCSMNCIILMEFHALYSRNCIYSMHLFHTSYFLYYILCISFSAFYSLHLIPCIVVYVSCILYFMHKRNKLVHCPFCRKSRLLAENFWPFFRFAERKIIGPSGAVQTVSSKAP